ncbi:hypothetical protein D8T54_19690 [Vibrio vulnificus]|nr:hypothetical protein D8T54_19690 [Vibrio vulnificus]RZR41906.1 hypothetical protein D8T58_20175 [Vibrio vulnificus]
MHKTDSEYLESLKTEHAELLQKIKAIEISLFQSRAGNRFSRSRRERMLSQRRQLERSANQLQKLIFEKNTGLK